MGSSIVVPVDGSPFGEQALPLAAAVARQREASIELVHVHEQYGILGSAPSLDLRLDQDLRAEAHKRNARLAERVRRESGVQVDPVFLDGPVVATLLVYLKDSGADLVVMSTRGRGAISHIWLGSVADQVVRHAGRPVLLVRSAAGSDRSPEAPVFRRILVPLDGSHTSESVLDHAVALGVPGRTEFVLLTVVPWPPPVDAMMGTGIGAMASGVEQLPDRPPAAAISAAATHLAGAAEMLRRAGFSARADTVVHADAARGIAECVTGYGADLLAMSTHGRGRLDRLLAGSVASKVVRRVQVPVLLYRPGPADAAPGFVFSERMHSAAALRSRPTGENPSSYWRAGGMW